MKNFIVPAIISAAIALVMCLVLVKPGQTVIKEGATSGADFNYACETHNGIQQCFTSVAFNQATTTVCAIKSPTATSTLSRGIASFTVSSTTASVVTMAKATTAFATTTSLGAATLGANVQATVTATTTPVKPLDDAVVFAPNTFLVVGMSGGTGTFSPTGVCQATFTSVNTANK